MLDRSQVEQTVAAMTALAADFDRATRNERIARGVPFFAHLLSSLRLLGTLSSTPSLTEKGTRAWRLSDQQQLRQVLLEVRLQQETVVDVATQGGHHSLAEQWRGLPERLARLEACFLGSLEPTAWVIRGGVVRPDQLRAGIAEHLEVPGLVGFSVNSESGLTVDDLASAVRYPNGQLSVTTVGKLQELGAAVLPSPGRAFHCTVVSTADQVERLAAVFTQRHNAHRRQGT